MSKREPTMEEALRKFTKEIQDTAAERAVVGKPVDYAQPHVRAKEREYNTTWLEDMAKALLDARYGELMQLSEGIVKCFPSEEKGEIEAMAKAIHQWAKTYVGE